MRGGAIPPSVAIVFVGIRGVRVLTIWFVVKHSLSLQILVMAIERKFFSRIAIIEERVEDLSWLTTQIMRSVLEVTMEEAGTICWIDVIRIGLFADLLIRTRHRWKLCEI